MTWPNVAFAAVLVVGGIMYFGTMFTGKWPWQR